MHVGMCAFFQNLDGQHTDREVWQHELAMSGGGASLRLSSRYIARYASSSRTAVSHGFWGMISTPRPSRATIGADSGETAAT